MPKEIDQETESRCLIKDILKVMKIRCPSEYAALIQYNASDPYPIEDYASDFAYRAGLMLRNELRYIVEPVLEYHLNELYQAEIEAAEADKANETVRNTK
jgi:hypothetical protein